MVAASLPAPLAGATTATLAERGFGACAAGDAQAWATATKGLALGDDDPGQADDKEGVLSFIGSAARRSSRLATYLCPERLERRLDAEAGPAAS